LVFFFGFKYRWVLTASFLLLGKFEKLMMGQSVKVLFPVSNPPPKGRIFTTQKWVGFGDCGELGVSERPEKMLNKGTIDVVRQMGSSLSWWCCEL
jgi:hypothetical protein